MHRKRSAVAATLCGALILVTLLTACASQPAPTTTAAAGGPHCVKPSEETHLDVAGPGQPDPEGAVLRVLRGDIATTTIDGDQATVIVVSTSSGLVRVRLHRAPDGWWPDSFRRCVLDES